MNVYFCDVCGVRVTDVDLHSGHGMRRRNDVICAACIDLGHGKEWVASHAHAEKPAMAAAGVGSSSNAGAGSTRPSALSSPTTTPPPRPLEAVRDRVRTMDDDEPASPVVPVAVPRPAAAAAPIEAPSFDDTAQVPVVNQELSSMAAGFAALSPPRSEKLATDEDDIEELPAPKLDDSGPTPVIPPSSPFADPKADAEPAVSLGAHADDDDAEKSETAVSAHSIGDADRPEPKRSAGAGATRAKTSSSRVGKSAKSSRSVRRPKKSSQQMMLISIASMALIVIFGVVVISNSKGTHTGGEKIPMNVTTHLRDAVSNAKSLAKGAVGSHDLAKLTAAHSAVMDVRSAVSEYERVANQNHFTEEAIESGVSGYGVMDVYSVDRAIRDEIEVVKARQH